MRIRRLSTAALSLSLGLLAAGVAHASSPHAIFSVPRRVDFLPDEANATKVVLHGAFFFRNANNGYDSPSCGQMYFACQAGQEVMCRMQWQDIKKAIGLQECAGFGEYNMLSKATVRAEGSPLGTPDTWQLGMGVSPGAFVDNQCPKALLLKCPQGGVPDAGAADASPPAGDLATQPPATDLASTPADMGVSPKPSPDLAQGPVLASNGGCAITQRPASPLATLALLLFLAAAIVLQRSNRRR
ncbi:MAG: hypothetical protein EXR72_10125 [Myxococcales bacterium]|nr:hypothetical protein [Myxococcales bacterium]